MEIKVVSAKDNPLLKRKEVEFKIEHGLQNKTPARLDVKKALSNELKVNEGLVFVKDMRTLTGTGIAIGHANAYESEVQAKLVEPDYIVKRNNPTEKAEEEAP